MHVKASRTRTGDQEKREGVRKMSKVRNRKGRGATLATVFALTVAAGITGATYSGISKEASIDDACAHVTWPNIPSYCP
jgi:hypothetical protein